MPTKIEWCDETINPQGWGCYGPEGVKDNLNPCPYCYARKLASRELRKCPDCNRFIPHWHPEQLVKPLKWKTPKAIFVQSMGDLWHPSTPDNQIREVLSMIQKCPHHTFLFLTKHPHRYYAFEPFPENCWVGASTDTANHASTFTDVLFTVNSSHKFISAEPLLEDIAKNVDYDAINWIILGSLNRHGSPVPPEKGGTCKEWVVSIIEHAGKYNVPVFIKDALYQLYPDLPKRRDLPYKANR